MTNTAIGSLIWNAATDNAPLTLPHKLADLYGERNRQMTMDRNLINQCKYGIKTAIVPVLQSELKKQDSTCKEFFHASSQSP